MKNNFTSAVDKMRSLQIMYNIAMAKFEGLIQAINNDESKYYTPSVQDIHIGGEYELLHNGMWEPLKVVRQYDLEYDWEDLIFSKQLRVKHLTHEQIKNEGWEEYKTITKPVTKAAGNFTTIPYTKGIFTLWYDETRNYMRIATFSGGYRGLEILFNGKCLSINDLRYIQKLLNI